nr:integrase, catalytic region, zinc finger, CCHC-type, peptidase aspartic, catalytic [Tanacetum cinerariifolium]
MSTQQDIYAAGSRNRPPMLNKDNYVPWSSRIIRYARSRPNGKMIVDSIENGPYVRRMITTPGEPDLPVLVPESFHEQTDEELTETDIKRMDADDQAIQTILLGLPEDVYAAVDSCETAKEIWERVRQMMKGSDIGEQEKKAKLFNEWEMFTSTDGESIKSYYHRFMQLMNDLKRNKHFPENIASNLKFLNNLQPEWKRHVTIVRQTKNLHETDFTQIYDFLKMNQEEDRQIQNVGGNGENQFGQYAGQVAQNQQGFNAWQNGGIQGAQNAGVQSGGNQNRLVVISWIANQSGTGNVVAARAEGTRNGNQARHPHLVLSMTRLPSMTQTAQQSMVQSGGTVETSSAPNEEIRAHQETVYRNLVDQVAQEDKFLDKKVDLEARIKDLENILRKRDQTVQTMHMLNPKPYLFYHSNQKMALGYPNPSYLKKAQLKQQSLYNGNLLLEEHGPPVMYELEETLELAQESREKMRLLKKEIKPANYAKINHLSGIFVPQTTKSKEELFLSNVSNMVTVSKTISKPNEDLSDDTTLSVARNFLNEVKSSLVNLQRVVKQKMTLEVHNWSSSAHKEVHRIISHEIAPIINQVDARVQNFEIQFLQEAAKFVRDFKSLEKEADESLDKQKSLELKIERLLKASVSHDIMSIVQNRFADVPSDLRTELDRTKEKLELCIIKKEKEYDVKRLQARLRDLKGKSSNTPSASNTLDPWNQKLESKIAELEFQVVNYECEISHLKTTYKNLFDSIKSNRAHAKLHDLIFENAKLRARLFENTYESVKNTSGMSVTPHVDKPKLSAVTPNSKKLHASTQSHSVPKPREFNVVKHRNVIAPGMFKINPSQAPSVDLVPNKQSSASIRTNLITNSQRHVIVKENVTSNMATASSIGLAHTARTGGHSLKATQGMTLLLSKNQKTMSSEYNNIKLSIRNDKSEIVCDTCCSNLSVVRRLGQFQAYDREHQASHQRCVDVFGNCLGHNLFSVGHFCDADLEVAFRRNTCFIRDLDGVDLLKGNRFTNLYTINLYDTASASPICLMARATPTKSWLWHQRLSHLNFDTINDQAKNDLVSSLPKFKYAKEHLCPSCEQGKSKRASHPPKPVPNSKQRLHLLHMDLCGPIVAITHETFAAKTPQQNGVVERRNRTLVEAARTMLIFSHAPLFLWAEAIATACYTQNCSISHRHFNKTPYELIQGRKPNISYLHVFGDLCYPKNNREDIGKLGAKGDIGFFIGYSANYVAYRVYNRRTRKIMEMMNVTFDELSAMAFEQNSSRPGLQNILFEPLHNEFLGGRSVEAPRVIHAAHVLQNLQAPTASMSFQDSAPVPTNSSNTPVSSHNVDATSQQHAQQQRNLTPSPTASAADNVPNAVFEGDLFVNPFGTPSTESVVSSTQYVDPSNIHTFYQPYPHDYQWTKDHPLEQVIGEPSRPVLTRNQLKTDGDMCIYALTFNIMEPKTVKEALTDLTWIESMQEELHQFIRLDVWEL